jgi:hypothetical protein
MNVGHGNGNGERKLLSCYLHSFPSRDSSTRFFTCFFMDLLYTVWRRFQSQKDFDLFVFTKLFDLFIYKFLRQCFKKC